MSDVVCVGLGILKLELPILSNGRKEGTMKRYILEGEWSGYRSSQRRVVHRVVITKPERYKDLTWIRYTDGTSLDLRIRPALPRERVKEIHGYDSLISQCLHEGVNEVAELSDVKKANAVTA